jgi:MFS family permease
MADNLRRLQMRAATTSFLALFSVVGLALYGLPLYYDHMVTEFGWSRTLVTSGNAVSKLLVGPLFGFFAGWIVDRFGPRKLMLAGILMAGGALIGLGNVSALWLFYFFYLINALGYVCGGPLPNQVLLSRWFDKSRGKAMGFAYLGIGVGGAVVPLISYRLTLFLGWRGSLQALGVLLIALALPAAYFAKDGAPVRRQEDPQPDLRAGLSRRERDRRRFYGGDAGKDIRVVLRQPAFYLLALGSMCSIAAVGGANQHLKLFLTLDEHFSQSDAATVVSLVLSFSIAGRLLMGWLADRAPKKYVMLLIYSLVAASIPFLFFGGSRAPMYVFAAIFGVGLGGEYLIIPLMAADLFGLRALGKLMGVILTADGVAEALSPMLIGYLRETTGDYHLGFALLVGIALVGAAAILFLPQRAAIPVAEPVSA